MMNQAYAIEHLNWLSFRSPNSVSSLFTLRSLLYTLHLFIRLFVYSGYSSAAGVVLVLE